VARIAAAAGAASASAKKARWELPEIKEPPAPRVRRDIPVQRDFKAKKGRKAIQDRRDPADPKEIGVKWAFQDSQALTEFTVFKDLPDQEALAVWTAAMELRVSRDVPVFRVLPVLRVLRDRREQRARKASPADSV